MEHFQMAAGADNLQEVLTGTYGLYLTTHNYHWNVEGQNFLALHTLFEAQYNELFLAVDLIAERIRALGSYVRLFESDNIVQLGKMTPNSLTHLADPGERAQRMLSNLIGLTESLFIVCQSAKDEAQDVADDETDNLMVERITIHQKALWMLRSSLK